MLISFSGKSTRKRRIRRKLSEAAEATVADVVPQVSACPAANSGSATVEKSRAGVAEADAGAQRHCIRSTRQVKVRYGSGEILSDVVTSPTTLTADECESSLSNSSRALRSGKSSAGKTIVAKNSDTVPVVIQSTRVAAAAITPTCVVVIQKSSFVAEQCLARNTSLVDGRNEKVGTASRGKKRRCQTADDDVEPMEMPSTSSCTASCKYWYWRCSATHVHLRLLFSAGLVKKVVKAKMPEGKGRCKKGYLTRSSWSCSALGGVLESF